MLGISCVTKLPDLKKSFLFAFQSLVLLTVHSQEASELLFIKWSGELNVPDPVAIAFDDWGNAYVTQTERRKVQDLDIRQHPLWLEDDLSFESVEQKRSFFRKTLTPENHDAFRHTRDFNEDGVIDFKDLGVCLIDLHYFHLILS
jgi:hypothetical protein